MRLLEPNQGPRRRIDFGGARKPGVPQPLLKWAGGKRQLLPALRPFLSVNFRRYHEPFVGSGAVFFDLCASGRLDDRAAVLADDNPDLIGCYRMVRDHPEEVIRRLARLARGYAEGGATHFYEVRERFNDARLVGAARQPGRYTPALAAMFLYLNRTGYNGLFRLNASGRFNVPAGRYVRPRICDAPNIRAVSRALARRNVRLALAPFESVLDVAAAGDLVYFDPPYAPMSATARFTAYTARAFTLADHERLRDVAVALAGRGCTVLVSNSSAPAIEALYEGDPRTAAAGLGVHRLPARRAINSQARARGPVTEFLLTNARRDVAVAV